MNIITINSYEDYVSKASIIFRHGKKKEVGNQKYTELCPCCVEVNFDCINELAKKVYFKKAKTNSDIKYLSFVNKMNYVVYRQENFTDIKGSEYFGSDYEKVQKSFSLYVKESINGLRTRRQFSYSFGEKLCMNGMQIFEDEGIIILNFRSCDYIKKFPFDLLFIKILIDDYCLNIKKVICNFGSLHIYSGDEIES